MTEYFRQIAVNFGSIGGGASSGPGNTERAAFKKMKRKWSLFISFNLPSGET
jgi:hypothetical protein